MSKIWIPRSTSGFTGADGAIKIGGSCYRAIQKNITKAQAPTASSYHEPTHGSLGDKFSDCSSCDATGSSWGAVFWFSPYCDAYDINETKAIDGFPPAGFDGIADYLDETDLSDTTELGQLTDFLDELIAKKSTLNSDIADLIIENPTATSFSSQFNVPTPDYGRDTTTYGNGNSAMEWLISADCLSEYTEDYGDIGSEFSLNFLHPASLNINTFEQSGSSINGTVTTNAFSWNNGSYKITRLIPSLSPTASITNLSLSHT
jgi:hypothetical protein